MSEQKAVAKVGDVLNMTPEQLKTQDTDVLVNTIVQFSKNSLAVLGQDQGFVRRDKGGNIIGPIVGKLTLSQAKGHIYTMKSGGKEATSITADGYYAMNQWAGLQVITPEFITLPDGSKVTNPYMVRETNRLGKPVTKGIWVRKKVIGYSPTGTLCVVNATLFFDLDTYFIQDVFQKIQYTDAGELKMEGALTTDEKKEKLVLPFDYGMVIVANPAHKEIMKVISTQIQRIRFAERIANTICERNALKRHPLIAAVKVAARDGLASVKVFGWKPTDKQETEMESAVKSAEMDSEFDGAEVIDIDGTIDNDDMDAVNSAYNEAVQEESGAKKTEADKDPELAKKAGATEDVPEESDKDLFSDKSSPSQKKKALEKKHGVDKVAKAIADSHPEGLFWNDIKQGDRSATINSAAAKLGEK